MLFLNIEKSTIFFINNFLWHILSKFYVKVSSNNIKIFSLDGHISIDVLAFFFLNFNIFWVIEILYFFTRFPSFHDYLLCFDNGLLKVLLHCFNKFAIFAIGLFKSLFQLEKIQQFFNICERIALWIFSILTS